MSSKYPMRPAKPLPEIKPRELVLWPDKINGPYMLPKCQVDELNKLPVINSSTIVEIKNL